LREGDNQVILRSETGDVTIKSGGLNIRSLNTLIESTRGGSIDITNLKITRYEEIALN